MTQKYAQVNQIRTKLKLNNKHLIITPYFLIFTPLIQSD